MRTRTITVIAASVGVAVATATGVTYASSALESAPESPPVTKKAAPAAAPIGGNGTGVHTDAASDPAANDNFGSKRSEGRGGNGRENGRGDGRIQINERTYSAEPGTCIAVVNLQNAPFGAVSFNIRNDSERTVEFFGGITCDNGAPIATVGPRSSTSNVMGQVANGLIVGSFRVLHDHDHNNNHNRN